MGKSNRVKRQQNLLLVHPHTCGEIAVNCAVLGHNSGSPPHVWGNLFLFLPSCHLFRFTPTRVGKSSRHNANRQNYTVHPHTCGEIWLLVKLQGLAHGSPPHVWGNLRFRLGFGSWLRFTPTRVGKSSCAGGFWANHAVHPHTCGEICVGWSLLWLGFGSPPHVWGNLQSPALKSKQPRFTPTRVGKSKRADTWPLHKSVHPHTCGEIQFALKKN